MASRRPNKSEDWFIQFESTLEQKTISKKLSLNRLLKSIDKYYAIQGSEQHTIKHARNLILEASKRIIERSRKTQEKSLNCSEGSRKRLSAISKIIRQLNELLDGVLLHIEETDYAKNVLTEFMPYIEEAARYATLLDPETAALMLRILDTAESIDFEFNNGLREVFEEVIQLQIIPKNTSTSKVLLNLAEIRFNEGEYLTSYLLSREAVRTMIEDLAGAYPEDLSPENKPGPEWRFEDYVGHLMEIGLIPEDQGNVLVELFVGEPEHLNERWKKRKEAEKAIGEVKIYFELMDTSSEEFKEWR
jgi:hypothetical protein